MGSEMCIRDRCYKIKRVLAVLAAMEQIPTYLPAIYFDFEKSLWTADDIDALGDLLCRHAHRFSRHSTDLGHVTVDPFRIILKKDAQLVKRSRGPSVTR